MLTRVLRDLRARKEPRFALVLSAGRTATQWLTMALNLHPDFFASHGQDLMPVKWPSVEAYACGARDHFGNAASFDWNDVDGYFNLLQAQGRFRVYANVHGIMSTEPSTNPEKFVRKYRSVAMVRHPLHRVHSFVSKWNAQHVGPSRHAVVRGFFEGAADLMIETCERYGIDRNDHEAIFFIQAVKTTFLFDSLYFGCNIPIIMMERITSDLGYFCEMFEYLTDGVLKTKKRYLSKIAAMARIDHLSNWKEDEVVEKRWKSWQVDHFYDQLTKSALCPVYLKLGYNFRR